VGLIGNAASIDYIEASSDIRADAFPFVEGEYAEFEQNHRKTPG
jgi:hypothetical protein